MASIVLDLRMYLMKAGIAMAPIIACTKKKITKPAMMAAMAAPRPPRCGLAFRRARATRPNRAPIRGMKGMKNRTASTMARMARPEVLVFCGGAAAPSPRARIACFSRSNSSSVSVPCSFNLASFAISSAVLMAE